MAAELSVKIGANDSELQRKLKRLENQVVSFGRKLQNFGSTLSRNVTAPIVAAGGLGVKVFADFEQTMAKVEAVSGATGESFQSLLESAKELGATTQFSAAQVANLQLNLSKLGFESSEIEDSTSAILDLALATGEDLAQSATVAASTLRGFRLPAKQMIRVSNVMADSFSSTALDLEKFSTAMSVGAPVASEFGVSIEETTALMGVLANAGVDASTVGTALRNVFLDLADKGLSFEEAMKKITSSTNPLATAMELFGKRGATVATIIANNSTEIVNLTKDFQDSAGEARKMASIMEDTLQGAFIRLKSALEGAGIAIGEVLKPLLESLIVTVNRLVTGFNKLTPKQQEQIILFAGLAAALGPVLLVVGKLLVSLKGLSAVLLAGATPIGAVVAGLGLLAALLIDAWRNSATFRAEAQRLFQEIKQLVGGITGLIGKLRELVGDLDKTKKAAFSVREQLSEFARAFADIIAGINAFFELRFADGFRLVMGGLLDVTPFGALASKFGFDLGDKITQGIQRKFKSNPELAGLLGDSVQFGETTGTTDLTGTVGVVAPTSTEPLAGFAGGLEMIGEEAEKLPKKFTPFNKSASEIAQRMEYLRQRSETLTGATIGFGDSAIGVDQVIQNAAESVGNYRREIETLPELTEETVKAHEQMKVMFQEVAAFAQILQTGLVNGLVAAAEGLAALGSAGGNLSSFLLPVFNSLLGVLEQVGKLAIKTGVAMLGIKKALNFGNPFTAIAAGVALIALSKLVRGTLSSLTAPKLADGGLAFGPTLAIVGDNPGASSNPEVIAPLDKLKEIMGARDVNVTGTFKIKGPDLVLAVEKAGKDMNRIR